MENAFAWDGWLRAATPASSCLTLVKKCANLSIKAAKPLCGKGTETLFDVFDAYLTFGT